MRHRKAVEARLKKTLVPLGSLNATLELFMEVLLDIRELLEPVAAPKVKHADCAEPPEVKVT